MMLILLDTPVLLWWLADDHRLLFTTRNSIARPESRVMVSCVTAWEIASLVRRGLVSSEAGPVSRWLPREVAFHQFEWLPLDYRHVLQAQELRRYAGLDPYDRLLVAQASIEGLTLATTNEAMRVPGLKTLPALEQRGARRLGGGATGGGMGGDPATGTPVTGTPATVAPVAGDPATGVAGMLPALAAEDPEVAACAGGDSDGDERSTGWTPCARRFERGGEGTNVAGVVDSLREKIRD